MFSPEYLGLAGVTAAMAGFEAVRYFRHLRFLKKIPVRIHVNGTRGKSSVTRLIAAGLRSGGGRVFAKTTGTLPRLIFPNGREYPIERPGGANIIEQKKMVAIAAKNGAEVLVLECMALSPHLQWLSEAKLVRATHGVITNARADHLDVMGPTEEDVALALAGSVPSGAKFFTGLGIHQNIFEKAARERKSEYRPLSEKESAEITPEDLKKFSYIEHAENVALALKVCADLGVARGQALKAMQESNPDPGAMIDCKIDFFGRHYHFINGFAANDPQSTEQVWRLAIEKFGLRQAEAERQSKRIAIFNCRADRPDRSLQLGKAFVHWPKPDFVVLMGSGTYIFAKAAAKAGFDMGKLVFAEENSAELIFERLVDVAGPQALMVGMGNIGGLGLELVRFFKNRAKCPTLA